MKHLVRLKLYIYITFFSVSCVQMDPPSVSTKHADIINTAIEAYDLDNRIPYVDNTLPVYWNPGTVSPIWKKAMVETGNQGLTLVHVPIVTQFHFFARLKKGNDEKALMQKTAFITICFSNNLKEHKVFLNYYLEGARGNSLFSTTSIDGRILRLSETRNGFKTTVDFLQDKDETSVIFHFLSLAQLMNDYEVERIGYPLLKSYYNPDDSVSGGYNDYNPDDSTLVDTLAASIVVGYRYPPMISWPINAYEWFVSCGMDTSYYFDESGDGNNGGSTGGGNIFDEGDNNGGTGGGSSHTYGNPGSNIIRTIAPPNNLSSFVGTPDYYSARYADYFRRYGDLALKRNYYNDYGPHYYSLFFDNQYKFSEQGKQWVNLTAYYLQDLLEKRLQANPWIEDSWEGLQSNAFDLHPIAYIQAGILDLPFEDKLTIVSIVNGYDLLYGDGLWQVLRVVQAQLLYYGVHPEKAYLDAQYVLNNLNMILDIVHTKAIEYLHGIKTKSIYDDDIDDAYYFNLIFGDLIQYYVNNVSGFSLSLS